jgi:hypothetical protein
MKFNVNPKDITKNEAECLLNYFKKRYPDMVDRWLHNNTIITITPSRCDPTILVKLR